MTPSTNTAIIPPLFNAEVREKKIALKVIVFQIMALLLIAGVVNNTTDMSQYAVALLSGGGVSILNGMLLFWRMFRAMPDAFDVHQQLRLMYFYAAERFLLVVLILGICLAVMKSALFAVLVGFILGQGALLIARLIFRL